MHRRPPIFAAEEIFRLSLSLSFYKRCFAKMSLAECSSLHNKQRFLSDGNGGNNAKNEVGMRPSDGPSVVPKGSFENSEFALSDRGEDEN